MVDSSFCYCLPKFWLDHPKRKHSLLVIKVFCTKSDVLETDQVLNCNETTWWTDQFKSCSKLNPIGHDIYFFYATKLSVLFQNIFC